MDTRSQIVEFIEQCFTEDDFKRGKGLFNKYLRQFETYEDFLADQRRILSEASPDKLELYRSTMHGLKNKLYDMVDMEDFGQWNADGFFLDNGRVILFHGR